MIFTLRSTPAPILDPRVFLNRTFITAAGAALLSYLGMLGIVVYSPILIQNVMKINATTSSTMLTSYTTLVVFLRIPGGDSSKEEQNCEVYNMASIAYLAHCGWTSWLVL
jgi:hypothetical protein